MPDSYTAALGASRMLLRILRMLNVGAGALLIGCFLVSFAFEPAVREFFTKQPPRTDPALLMPILRVWMLLAVPAIAAVHVLLSRLLDMVETVRAADPFVPENGVRMHTIAWCMLAVQLFDLACGALAAAMNAAGSNIHWSFSVTGWLAVALLFVLARVFDEGARIRADLEVMI
ncbi:MAG: DUF2975 domain-containing protein [Pseudomonadota bacterium]|nr:DUF2975 domain-containing protein [Pseudomonadota bacterium]